MATATTESARIRARLGHPVIDGDGHYLDLRAPFHAYVRDHGAAALLDNYQPFAGAPLQGTAKAWNLQTPAERKQTRVAAPPFWVPPGETKYFATVSIPKLYYERLAETGIDFSVLYPTVSFGLMHNDDDEARRGLCYWFNEWVAEMFGPYTDRMAVAGLVPMHDPAEAIAELEHLKALGIKVACIPSYVARTVPMFESYPDEVRRRIRWLDWYGIDSLHDYDPFWAKAIELGLPLGCHSPTMGFLDRASSTNYMFNHCGHFAAGGDGLAKALFFGGVTRRFPNLKIALLEGGVTLGVRLYGDLVSRWKKRGGENLKWLDPGNIDLTEMNDIIASYDSSLARFSAEELVYSFGRPHADLERDDFAMSGVRGIEDIRDQFVANFYWGCEADDPMVGLAFDPRMNPLGATLPAIMGSDIGHWDVPDFDEPVAEAYELVDHGILNLDQFRDFVFANQVRLYGGANPNFFAGTSVEDAARDVLP